MNKFVIAASAMVLVFATPTHAADSEKANSGSDKSAKAAAAARADSDMQAVLDAHASLKPKPLEKLTAKEARAQPTVADAVKAVLKKQKRSTAPTDLVPGVASADRTIPGAAGQIPARIYTPSGSGPFPVIVYSTAVAG